MPRYRLLLLTLVLVGVLLPVFPTPAASQADPPAQPRRQRLSIDQGSALRSAKAAERRAWRAGPRAARPVPLPSPIPLEHLEFDAIERLADATPADPTGAAGTTHIVTAVNVHTAVYDRSGNEVVSPIELESLFPTLPDGIEVFDPKVVYDRYRNRFVLAFLAVQDASRRSWILIVSIPDATAGDQDSWCRRRLNGDQVGSDGPRWADYPSLGFDKRRVYVSTNQFTFTFFEFAYAQILALGKNELYDCDRPVSIQKLARAQTLNPDGSQAFTIQPAVTQTESGRAPPEYMLSFQWSCGRITCSGRRLVLWRLTIVNGQLRLAKTALSVDAVRIAPLGTQRGGVLPSGGLDFDLLWDTGDLRLINAFYDADRDRLYAAHAIEMDLEPGDGYPESVVAWYEVDPSDSLSSSRVRRRGLIGQARTDSGWPVVATDGAGNVLVTYSRASAVSRPPEFLSAWGAVIPPGSLDPQSALLTSGTATFDYVDGEERWGDFNGISRDPTNPQRVWMVNQYARDTGSPTTDVWQQVVHEVSAP